MSYVLGAALDHPLELRRYEHGDTLFVTHATSSQTSGLSIDPVIVFPHGNWRGDYTVGTYEGGRTSLCVKYANNPVDQTPVGEDPGFTEPLPDDSSRYCFAGVQWPAAHLWLDHGLRDARPKATPGFWAGSLIHNKRDLSGNLYMRNRFYDPASGRFTQEDPDRHRGRAQRLWLRHGDPVTFSDPYGLTVTFAGEPRDRQLGIHYWNRRAQAARESRDPREREAGHRLVAMMRRMQEDTETTYVIRAYRFNSVARRVYGHGNEGQDRFGQRRGQVMWEVNVDTEGPDPVRTLAHELGGAESRAQGGSHDEPSVAAENNYRRIRTACAQRRDHGHTTAGSCP